MNRFRRLLIRWEKDEFYHLGMLHLACGIVAFQRSGLFGWLLASLSFTTSTAMTLPLTTWKVGSRGAWPLPGFGVVKRAFGQLGEHLALRRKGGESSVP